MAVAALTIFGYLGAFIQVRDDPQKLWNMGVASLALVIACVAFKIWRDGRAKLPPSRKRRIAVVSLATVSVFVLVAGLVSHPVYWDSSEKVEPTDNALTATPTALAASEPDVPPGPSSRMHEIWASSSENGRIPLDQWSWAATEFRVTEPQLVEVQMAAGPNSSDQVSDEQERVQMLVYDEEGREIAQGETVIIDWRAIYRWEHPIDVSMYQGKRLLLMLKNISPDPKRVYTTKHDRDQGVTAFRNCDERKVPGCPLEPPVDISAMVTGLTG